MGLFILSGLISAVMQIVSALCCVQRVKLISITDNKMELNPTEASVCHNQLLSQCFAVIYWINLLVWEPTIFPKIVGRLCHTVVKQNVIVLYSFLKFTSNNSSTKTTYVIYAGMCVKQPTVLWPACRCILDAFIGVNWTFDLFLLTNRSRHR